MSYLEQRRRFLGRSFKLIGRDGNTIQFKTPSWTEQGVEYEVHVNFDSGEMRCNCSGSLRWRLVGDVFKGGGCKHSAGLALLLSEHLERHGITNKQAG